MDSCQAPGRSFQHLIFSLEKDSVHSGISLQKGAIIVHYGFWWWQHQHYRAIGGFACLRLLAAALSVMGPLFTNGARQGSNLWIQNKLQGVHCTLLGVTSHSVFFVILAKVFRPCPNVSTTSITAMGCRQCLALTVVQLKGKHCHCQNGVVDTFGPTLLGHFFH